MRAILRSPRAPGAVATEDVRRLLLAAGLEGSAPLDVTVTTPAGLWSNLVEDQPLTIGRAPEDTHLVIADSSVSRRHCRIARTGDVVTVEDLASANGTWLHRRDERLVLEPGRPVRAEHGDWVRTGPEVALAYIAVVPRTDGSEGR